jgi:hypothetical protein
MANSQQLKANSYFVKNVIPTLGGISYGNNRFLALQKLLSER